MRTADEEPERAAGADKSNGELIFSAIPLGDARLHIGLSRMLPITVR